MVLGSVNSANMTFKIIYVLHSHIFADQLFILICEIHENETLRKSSLTQIIFL